MLPDPWSSSLYEYTIKTIFIHIDDPSQTIQDAIMKVLRIAATKQTMDFINVARDQERKSAHPALCKSLAEYAQEILSKK